MKVVKRTGLVPVRHHSDGMVSGVKPEVAKDLVLKKLAELVPVREDIETYDVPDPVPPEPEKPKAKVDPGRASIPVDWETMHHLKRFALAQALTGQRPASDEEARKVIAEEVAKRSADTA